MEVITALLSLGFLIVLIAVGAREHIREREKAEKLKWRAFALCVNALERFARRAQGDVVIEAVILAAKKKPGPVPKQLVQKRAAELPSSEATKRLARK